MNKQGYPLYLTNDIRHMIGQYQSLPEDEIGAFDSSFFINYNQCSEKIREWVKGLKLSAEEEEALIARNLYYCSKEAFDIGTRKLDDFQYFKQTGIIRAKNIAPRGGRKTNKRQLKKRKTLKKNKKYVNKGRKGR